jgi:hypothetical protein
MVLLLEKTYPPLVGIGVAIMACLLMPSPVEGMKEVVQSIVNTSAIAVGFLATSLSILYTIGKSRIMEDLKKIGRTDIIVGYFLESLGAWFLLAIVGGLLLLLDYRKPDEIPQWGRIMLVLMCGMLAWSIATLVRIVSILRLILNSQ